MEEDIFVRQSFIFEQRVGFDRIRELKLPIKAVYLLVCSVEFALLSRTLASILRQDPDAVICVIANSTRDRQKDTEQRTTLIKLFEESKIDLLLINKFSSATNLAKETLKKSAYLQFYPFITDETWMIYTDPDMPFESYSLAELDKEATEQGISAYGHRGGYYDWESPDLSEYMWHSGDNKFSYSDRLQFITGFCAVRSKIDCAVSLTSEGYYPLFWFDDVDRAFRLRQHVDKFGLVPFNWVSHIPHSASGQTPGLFTDATFINGKQKLKEVWYETGIIPYIAPVASDRQFIKEGVIYDV